MTRDVFDLLLRFAPDGPTPLPVAKLTTLRMPRRPVCSTRVGKPPVLAPARYGQENPGFDAPGSSGKNRLMNRVRQNPDFLAIARWCEDRGLAYRVEQTGRLGHPKIVIIDGERERRRPIGCSPGARINTSRVIADLERWWFAEQEGHEHGKTSQER